MRMDFEREFILIVNQFSLPCQGKLICMKVPWLVNHFLLLHKLMKYAVLSQSFGKKLWKKHLMTIYFQEFLDVLKNVEV